MRIAAVILLVLILTTNGFSQTPTPQTPVSNAAVIPNPASAANPAVTPASAASQPAQTPQQPQTPQVQKASPSVVPANTETIDPMRDTYKQIIEAHQKTLVTLQWAMGIIGTLLLALVGYIAFKNKKEYDEAKKEAKESAKEARDACDRIQKLEERAIDISTRIDTLANGKLDKIDKQAKAELDEIKKQGEIQIRDLLAEAEKQRKLSQLQEEALRLDNEDKLEEARGKYEKYLKIEPESGFIQFRLCNNLAKFAAIKKDNDMLSKARCIYENLKAQTTKSSGAEFDVFNQIRAGMSIVKAYIEVGKEPDANDILGEIEPFAMGFSEGVIRNVLIEEIKELRQNPGMK